MICYRHLEVYVALLYKYYLVFNCRKTFTKNCLHIKTASSLPKLFDKSRFETRRKNESETIWRFLYQNVICCFMVGTNLRILILIWAAKWWHQSEVNNILQIRCMAYLVINKKIYVNKYHGRGVHFTKKCKNYFLIVNIRTHQNIRTLWLKQGDQGHLNVQFN